MAYRTPELQLIGGAANLVLEDSLSASKVPGGANECDRRDDEITDAEFYTLPGNW